MGERVCAVDKNIKNLSSEGIARWPSSSNLTRWPSSSISCTHSPQAARGE